MKFIKPLSIALLVSSVLLACKKEPVNTSETEQTTSINYGNGVVETFQRQPNGSTVVFSNWVLKTDTDWTGYGTSEISSPINAPSLSDAVRDNGLVMVYFELAGKISPLPYVRIEYGQVIDFNFITQLITLNIRTTQGSLEDVADLKFRYVLIPSSAFSGPGSGGRMNTTLPVDYNDYNAVCDFYGIPK